MSEAYRERSRSELVFGVLKTLMMSYRLWGSSSGMERAHLSDALRTTEPHLGGVLDYLAAEGLVHIDAGSGTVRLTDQGARALLVNSPPARSLDGCVSPRKVALDSAQSHACVGRRRISRSGRGADW